MVLSVMIENVDCYNSGVICRKSLLIAIGRSFVAFDDDSGKPVRTAPYIGQPLGILLNFIEIKLMQNNNVIIRIHFIFAYFMVHVECVGLVTGLRSLSWPELISLGLGEID